MSSLSWSQNLFIILRVQFAMNSLKLLSLKYIFYNRESQSEVQTDFCELQSVRETRVVRSKTYLMEVEFSLDYIIFM